MSSHAVPSTDVDSSTPENPSADTLTPLAPEKISSTDTSLHDHPSDLTQSNDEPTYPGPVALSLLMLGICLSGFLVALDRTIVATAIPRITDEFNSPGDVGWYGSAYLLTSCAFQTTYGRVFSHFDVRWSFLAALGLFELGSLICGAAPSSSALIVGRAIAGLGCAGVFAGCLVIVSMSVPLAKRPVYMAAVGSIYGIGSICGPIIGGAFTNSVSWRWCFYINLPVGAITLVTLLVFFHPKRSTEASDSFVHRIRQMDLIGNVLLVTTVTMLLLALQFGGTTFAWNSAQVIGLLVGAGVELLVFIAWQRYRGADALIPFQIVRQRTVAASCSAGFFLVGTMLVHSYYLPYWFQAIRHDSPIISGVHVIPYLGSNFLFSIVAGTLVTKTGYFNPPALIGPIIAVIGCGLITTFDLETSTAKWVGCQIITAAGLGLAVQQGFIAVQATQLKEAIPIGTALILFFQSLSGAVFVSVGSSLLRNELRSGLSQAKLPGVDIKAILAAGATDVRHLVPASQLVPMLNIYNDALQKVLIIAIPLTGLGLFSAIPMEWKSVKGKSLIGEEG